MSNYHRFFWRAVNAYRRALGLPMVIDIGSRSRREEALRRTLGRQDVLPLEQHTGLIEALAEHEHPIFRDGRTPEPGLLERSLEVVRTEQRAGRLVFDDLGALFWTLLERFPSVAAAYRRRFPIVIADEHQDSSALQDAVVRRLGSRRMVILADPLQLIHGFRGAADERLEAHRRDCDQELTLATPHRWHGVDHLGHWLLAVRARLMGQASVCSTPSELTIVRTNRQYGFNEVKAKVKHAVGSAFRDGMVNVAVLALSNSQVGSLRSYLCREGFRPRQIGSADFEDARVDIEQLPLFRDAQAIALHAIERIGHLLPTLRPAALDQARSRVGPNGVNLRGAGAEARMILEPLAALFEEAGCVRYFEAVVGVVTAAQSSGHHVPRVEAFRALRRAADDLSGRSLTPDEAISRYSADVIEAAHVATRTDRGLFVMTAHQAKGKESDCVVLADASAQLFPDTYDGRRLFYVAVNRATKRWVVIAPDTGASPLLGLLVQE